MCTAGACGEKVSVRRRGLTKPAKRERTLLSHSLAQGCSGPGHLVPTSLGQRLEDGDVQFPPFSENV